LSLQVKVIFPLLAVTKLLGLLAMWLSSDMVLPLDYVTYATDLQVILVQSSAKTDCTNSLGFIAHSFSVTQDVM
jgi:hypothetical protein